MLCSGVEVQVHVLYYYIHTFSVSLPLSCTSTLYWCCFFPAVGLQFACFAGCRLAKYYTSTLTGTGLVRASTRQWLYLYLYPLNVLPVLVLVQVQVVQSQRVWYVL